ncbi:MULTISPECIES: ThuA domain-containing protein [Streptomyces]|uniref:ThuA domain-containing protein n=1 Tax=Streptomyces phaeolivaceus TaxID=2653200 RepID=A0A5P8KE36_9ACTN|nr:ThuA domain-containing protein [Streptomyces phaeolivaceus]QFR01594.1 ThuA domain-containing protein [Streptomyces phaeolivaceus]
MTTTARPRRRIRPLTAALTSVAGTLGITVALVATGTLSVAQGGGDRGARQLGDPDYGVCRGVDVRCYHDWGNFDTSKGFKVLLYTRTAGPRHANLGPALGTGLNPPVSDANVVQKALLRMGSDNGFQVDYTEDVTQLASAAALFKYNAVIFFSTSRDTLDDAAQTSLRQYIRGGGGFVGVHNAFGTEYNWPWYEGLLGNANFYDHGPAQPGTVRTVNSKDASTKSLPRRWEFSDEWYNLVPAPTRVRVLAEVDETTLARGVKGNYHHPGHGDDHAVAWCQYYDGGRAWLTTLGHDAKAFSTDGSFPGAAEFQKLILGGIESAMGKKPFCT